MLDLDSNRRSWSSTESEKIIADPDLKKQTKHFISFLIKLPIFWWKYREVEWIQRAKSLSSVHRT